MKIVAIALFLLLVGCAKEPTAPQEKLNLDPHHITQEQALRTMNTVMGQLYSGTRAVRNYTIETLKGRDLQKVGTRFDDDDPIFPEDVLYIVNFDDDEGFAVLAADDHYEPVFAITELGHLSLNDFQFREETDSTELTDEEFIGSMIMQSIIVKKNTNPLGRYDLTHSGSLGGSFGSGGSNDRNDNTDVNNGNNNDPYKGTGPSEVSKVAPLLKTKWHQNYPFNLLCPTKIDTSVTMGVETITTFYAPTGCVATAMAQIIAYHEKPALSFYGINSITWAQLRNTDYSQPINSSNRTQYNATASIMRQIGDDVHMQYFWGDIFTSATQSKEVIPYFITRAHYSVVDSMSYSATAAVSELNFYRPVYICGSGSGGHAWVLDGYIGYRNPQTGAYDQNLMFHCNWGKPNGWCNGYYLSGIFDMRNGPVKIEAGVDSPNSSDDEYYTFDIGIIKLKP